MNWTEGPATWKQLRFLSERGYKPEHPLTKNEAADLIRNFGGQPETLTTSTSIGIPVEASAGAPYDFHTAVEIARRQEFWVDTCRDVHEMKLASRPIINLYHKHGCLLYPPSPCQVQAVLDALDP